MAGLYSYTVNNDTDIYLYIGKCETINFDKMPSVQQISIYASNMILWFGNSVVTETRKHSSSVM